MGNQGLKGGGLREEEGTVKIWWEEMVHPWLPETLIFGDFIKDNRFNFGVNYCPGDSMFGFKGMQTGGFLSLCNCLLCSSGNLQEQFELKAGYLRGLYVKQGDRGIRLERHACQGRDDLKNFGPEYLSYWASPPYVKLCTPFRAALKACTVGG